MNEVDNDTDRVALMQQAMAGESTPRLPIWLMRQAGRTDPAYNRLKAESGLPLESLFRHPQLAAEISLLPRRLNIDAIIFFQDILTPLEPMGANFIFDPAPRLEIPRNTPAAIEQLSEFDVAKQMPYVGETLDIIHDQLAGALPVLGFAGAPFTLALFILEGKSAASDASFALNFIKQHPQISHRLLEKLCHITIDYLRYQASKGVVAVQLFESCAMLPDRELYLEFALPYQQQIFRALKNQVKSIHFARGLDDLTLLDQADADIISLPAEISIRQAREVLGEGRIFQGNLDNQLLANGSIAEIKSMAAKIVKSGDFKGHIFNLSHGLLRETPYQNIVELVSSVQSMRPNTG